PPPPAASLAAARAAAHAAAHAASLAASHAAAHAASLAASLAAAHAASLAAARSASVALPASHSRFTWMAFQLLASSTSAIIRADSAHWHANSWRIWVASYIQRHLRSTATPLSLPRIESSGTQTR